MILNIVGITLTVKSDFPKKHPFVIVSNHVSYLDILLLLSLFKTSFIAKQDVQRWPLFGWIMKFDGTIFVNREKKSDLINVNAKIQDSLKEGRSITVFPEGTSSDGSRVLPFKSNVFEAVSKANSLLCPVYINYQVEASQFSVKKHVCWYAEMSFLPHLWAFFAIPKTHATLCVAPKKLKGTNRKVLAKEAYNTVLNLHNQYH